MISPLPCLPTCLPTLLALVCAPQAAAQLRGDLDDLRPVDSWTKLAHGVHVATLGDLSDETRYSDLAGAPPRIDALNRRSDRPLPSGPQQASWFRHRDGRLTVRIPTAPGEKIYGYGLQFDRTMHSGRILELKVDHFNKGGGSTHAPVPFFLSSAGYGLLFDTARYLKVHNQVGNRRDAARNPPEVDRNPPPDEPQPGPWLARPPGDSVEASLMADGLALVAFAGEDLLDVVARYNLYSGGGAMPPLWGLGFWHRTPSKYSAAQVEQELAEFDAHDIPLDVIGLEPGWQSRSYPCTFEWQPKRFPDPAAFTERLLDAGVRVNLWVNPYVSEVAGIHDALEPLSGSHMVWLGLVPDYTLPAAREILLEQHRRDHLQIGISGYKIDEVDGYDHWLWPDHATFPSGTPAETMRQTYGMLMQRMLLGGLFQPADRRTWSLVRATNGAASAYPFVLYSDSYGHGQYITGLSSASLAGLLWCPEIRSAKSEREWINRMHTVCLSPLAQLNAWASGTRPWSFPDATDTIRRTIQLRMQLLPYLYTAFANYQQHGIPPIRSLLLETGRVAGREAGRAGVADGEANPYGDGAGTELREDNSVFLFGPDILAAPFRDAQISREVQLPPGDWYDFHSGELAGGNGATITITATQTGDLPPLFVRDGAVIPMLAKPVLRTRDARGANLTLRHYGQAEGRCEVYEDDGDGFAFQGDSWHFRRFTVKDDTLIRLAQRGAGPRLYGEPTLRRMTPHD